MKALLISLSVMVGLCSGCVSMNTHSKALPTVVLRKTEGYARLAHPQIELQKGTYSFSCLLVDDIHFAETDKVPELFNTEVAKRNVTCERQPNGWMKYSCLMDVDKSGTYDFMISIWNFEEVRFSQLSLKNADGGSELLQNGSFETGLAPWVAKGGAIEWVQKFRPVPQTLKPIN